MNKTNKTSGESSPADAGREVKRLAALIRENRASLDKGWEELERLTQILAAPAAMKSPVTRPENSASPTSVGPDPGDQPPIVMVKE